MVRQVAVGGALAACFLACAGILDLPDTLPPPLDGGVAAAEAAASAEAAAPDNDDLCPSKGAAGCLACCTGNHAEGSVAFYAGVTQCVCDKPLGTGAVCQTECAHSDCSNSANAPESKEGDPCWDCQERAYAGGKCGATYKVACDGGAECLRFLTCWDQCPAH
jgi:hypothetical protein